MKRFVRLFSLLLGVVLMTVVIAADSKEPPDLRARMASDESMLHRVTDVPFKMDNEAAALCDRNPKSFHAHSNYYCHVYVNEAGLETMKSGKGIYPAGSVIIKQKYSDEEATEAELFTIMRKMTPGYDKAHGDWEYSIVDRTGMKELVSGRLEACIKCHTPYAKTDYVTRVYLTKESKPAK
ncbi:MAG: cytochrome P460 family protein [Planctomycetota bacterium]